VSTYKQGELMERNKNKAHTMQLPMVIGRLYSFFCRFCKETNKNNGKKKTVTKATTKDLS
jgi:hypothetical protein